MLKACDTNAVHFMLQIILKHLNCFFLYTPQNFTRQNIPLGLCIYMPNFNPEETATSTVNVLMIVL